MFFILPKHKPFSNKTQTSLLYSPTIPNGKKQKTNYETWRNTKNDYRSYNNELYIVTGVAGNLGSAIVRNLVANGKAVRSFALRGEVAARHLPEGANVYEGDVTDISTLDKLFSDISEKAAVYCIHCAAMVSVSNLVADRIWHVNVDGTRNIIDQCKAHDARLIFIGSTGAIPEEPKGTVIREVEHFDPNAVIGIYDQTKAASCQMVLDAVHAGEIDWMISKGVVTLPEPREPGNPNQRSSWHGAGLGGDWLFPPKHLSEADLCPP